MTRRTAVPIYLLFLLFLSPFALDGTAQPRTPAAVDAAKVERLVLELKTDLGLVDAVVRPRLVDRDPRLVSVRRSLDTPGEFDLRLERSFIETLTAEELRAVVAHELGHVWIYGHHPFLQTEELANRVARRVIGAEVLTQVYQKVEAFRQLEDGSNSAAPSGSVEQASVGLSRGDGGQDPE